MKKGILHIILLSVFFSLSCSSQFNPDANLKNLSGKIYFNSARTGDSEIYSMNTDGTEITNISLSPHKEDVMPAVSPDGSKVVFMRGNFYDWDSYELWIMDTDGSNQIQLTDNTKADGHPDFSPDGKRIVFASYIDGDDEIYMISSDGSGLKRLTDNSGSDNDPDFSPDGGLIAFKSTRAHRGDSIDEFLDKDYEIFLMDTNGTVISQLTNDTLSDHDPDFSPDGTEIAFLRVQPDQSSDVWIMNSDGSNQKNLTMQGDCWYTSWIMDGEYIAYCSSITQNVDIFIMKSDGTEKAQVTYSPFTDEFPAWRK